MRIVLLGSIDVYGFEVEAGDEENIYIPPEITDLHGSSLYINGWPVVLVDDKTASFTNDDEETLDQMLNRTLLRK